MRKKLILINNGKVIEKNIKKLEKAMGLTSVREEILLDEKCPNCGKQLVEINNELKGGILSHISFYKKCKNCGYGGETIFID